MNYHQAPEELKDSVVPGGEVTLYNQVSLIHQHCTSHAYRIWERKSQDYGRGGDPLANFDIFGSFGILVRMGDKLSRLISFDKKGYNAVTDESVEDTVLDLINYAILYLAYLHIKKNIVNVGGKDPC